MTNRRKFVAYILPMALFMGLLALRGLLKDRGASFWFTSAEFWIYPAQTILCGIVLLCFWREYPLNRPRGLGFGLLIGGLVFVIWIAPQALLGWPPRTDGFNPEVWIDQPGFYWATIILRFLRLVIVVPLLEEIFWRGFLLRFLIKEEFDQVPFGTFSWLSFLVVTAAFTFSHLRPDWPAAFICGALYNVVAYRTKSLSTCVITHAVTNLLLGFWIMRTGQWGFW